MLTLQGSALYAEHLRVRVDNGAIRHLKNNTRIADALIAVDQVHLLGLNLPLCSVTHDAMAGPAGELPYDVFAPPG